VKPDELDRDFSPFVPALDYGQWPGIRSGPNVPGRGIEVATASREPWVDANSYLVAYLRDLYPQRPAILGYRPESASAPYEGLEIALAEAVTAGGSYLLALPDDYRAALGRKEAKAVAAWESLQRTARFLGEHSAWFRQPNRSRLAFAAGSLDQSGELLRLLYRRNLCPVVLRAAALPPLDPGRFRGLVFTNLPPPTGEARGRIVAFARAGGTVITNGWVPPGGAKSRSDEDRDWYSLGQGRMVVYRDAIADPSEFALDVIDILGVRTRDLRLWNASAVIGLPAGAGPRAYLHLVNYGEPVEAFPARVDGLFRTATLWEPGAASGRALPVAKRGPTTEITVQKLARLATILLE
jgi:hypothetical protein